MARATHLLDDSSFYSETLPRLQAAGWSFTTLNRYDPTHFTGFTPTGKAFAFDAVSADDGSITGTLTIAGRTHTFRQATATWDATTTEAILTAARNLLPVNQR